MSSTSTAKTPVATSSAAPDDEYYNDDDEESSEELENEKIDPLAIQKLLAQHAVSEPNLIRQLHSHSHIFNAQSTLHCTKENHHPFPHDLISRNDSHIFRFTEVYRSYHKGIFNRRHLYDQ